MPRLLIRIKCELKVPSPLSKISLVLAAVNHSRCDGHSFHIQWQRNVFNLLMFCSNKQDLKSKVHLQRIRSFHRIGLHVFVWLSYKSAVSWFSIRTLPLHQDGMLPLTVVGPSLSIACFDINKPLLTSNEVGVSDMEMNVLPVKDELIRHTFVAFVFRLCLGTCCMSDGPD